MAAGDATYALQTDFEQFVEGWVTDDPDALKRLLERAERDIDQAAGYWLAETNGLKFGSPLSTNEKHLEAWQVAALTRATCAQAEYRFTMGEDFFVRAQHATERGPDFQVSGKLPWLAPKAKRELDDAGLVISTARALPGRVGLIRGSFGRARYDSFFSATRHDGT